MRLALAPLVLLGAPLVAQGPPGTDIYLVPLTAGFRLGAAVNVTARPGYDNQPSFHPDGRSFYFTSERGGQTDIYRYDLEAGTAAQITRTPESEYSPTVMPDRQHISVIRVERDSTQRLWSFRLDGTPDRPVLDSIKPVGYHTWLNPDTVFVFVLGTPATLRRAELAHGTAQIVATDIGRALARMPGGRAIGYVQQDSSGGWVRALDPASGQAESLVRLPVGASFFVWAADGSLLSASGNKVFRWSRGQKEWSELGAFTEPGLQQISRLALSPDGTRLALVGTEPQPPRSP